MVSRESINYLGISTDRLRHMLSVGERMERISIRLGWGIEKSRQMFFLGYIHDIGYEYSSQKEEHPSVGGKMLKELQYVYWKEVYYHGKVQTEYQSLELDLLNYCDMTTSTDGESVSIEGRLDDIKKRFGEQSICYRNAKIICESVKNKFE